MVEIRNKQSDNNGRQATQLTLRMTTTTKTLTTTMTITQTTTPTTTMTLINYDDNNDNVIDHDK